jgi:hypothetical protein
MIELGHLRLVNRDPRELRKLRRVLNGLMRGGFHPLHV